MNNVAINAKTEIDFIIQKALLLCEINYNLSKSKRDESEERKRQPVCQRIWSLKPIDLHNKKIKMV